MMMPISRSFDIFDDFFCDPFFTGRKSQQFGEVMKTDIKEKDGNYILDIDMPGINKKDINLELNDGYITVEAKTNSEVDDSNEDEGYIHKERYSGVYKRSYYVGNNTKEEDIKAKLENGILSLTIPKEEKKNCEKKLIQIQ